MQGSVINNEHSWLIEPFVDDDTFLPKRMFGCLACYLHGRLKLILADSEEPWNGVMVATSRAVHDSLRGELRGLEEHPVLGKWLYISHQHELFEKTVKRLVQLCLADDARIGVEPGERRKSRKPARKKR